MLICSVAVRCLYKHLCHGDIGVKPDIPIEMGLDDPSVFGIRATVCAFGTVLLPIGAAPHEVTAGLVITIGLHAKVFLA